MNQSNRFLTILKIIAFILCLSLVVAGQKTVGIPNLMMEVAGVIGIMILIYLYNRKYQ